MADKSEYTLTGFKSTRGEKSSGIKLSRNRSLMIGGEAVELSDTEADDLRERGYQLRKVSGGSKSEKSDTQADKTSKSEKSEKPDTQDDKETES
jgi:hypothetical protein